MPKYTNLQSGSRYYSKYKKDDLNVGDVVQVNTKDPDEHKSYSIHVIIDRIEQEGDRVLGKGYLKPNEGKLYMFHYKQVYRDYTTSPIT